MEYIKNIKSILSKERITTLLNALDREKTKAMERAESKCRKLNMGMVPYFPGLAMKAISVIFWKAIKRREEGAKVSIKYLIRMAKTAEYHGNLSKGILTLEIITQMVNDAEKEYMAIKKQAWECRETFITKLIEEAEGKNKTILKEIKKKRRDEQSMEKMEHRQQN